MASSQHKRWGINYVDKILCWQIKNPDADSFVGSARTTLCKLATSTRQTLLPAKQAKQQQTDPKQFLVMIKFYSDCLEKINRRYQSEELYCVTFIRKARRNANDFEYN